MHLKLEKYPIITVIMIESICYGLSFFVFFVPTKPAGPEFHITVRWCEFSLLVDRCNLTITKPHRCQKLWVIDRITERPRERDRDMLCARSCLGLMLRRTLAYSSLGCWLRMKSFFFLCVNLTPENTHTHTHTNFACCINRIFQINDVLHNKWWTPNSVV